MFEDIKVAYQKGFETVKADMIIPSGEVLQKLIEHGIDKVHRDTYHLSYGIGRFAVGLLWYVVLTGNSVKNNKFCDFDEKVSETEIDIAKKCVSECCGIAET